MKDNLPRYTLRVSQVLLDKLAFIAEFEGRTKNKEIEQLIKRRIAEFEKENGTIYQKNKQESLENGLSCLLFRQSDKRLKFLWIYGKIEK